jgi:outer membrane murein-binding lipoprotein Lpp
MGVLGVVLWVAVGCAGSPKPVDGSARVNQLASEVERLSREVARLAQRLEAEQKLVRSARPVPAQDCPVPQPAAAASVSVETELRNTQRALVRIVERLDLSPEAKRELLMAARPSRQLDDANPWVATQ